MNMKAAFPILLVLSALLHADEVKIALPPETGTYKTGSGMELAQANCMICHSTEYVASQPPMPRKFWEATVKKMKEKFGAPIPDAQIVALVDYLASTYGATGK
jgi:mono/diheme cytochrome c family protein